MPQSSSLSTRFADQVARELGLKPQQVRNTAALLEEGATIPFLARYRKEATGSLDEVKLTAIRDRLQKLADLEARLTVVLKSMRERDLLTPEREAQLRAASTLAELEDLYAPFRPKRRTRATIARERGLEPLAERILAGFSGRPEEEAAPFIDPDREIGDTDAALAGARDIIAEQVSEEPKVRSGVRQIFSKDSVIVAKLLPKKKDDPEARKYEDYFDWSEPLATVPSHRLLAMRRGEKEGFLQLKIQAPDLPCLQLAERHFIRSTHGGTPHLRRAIEDGCRRLLFPSLETETGSRARSEADEEAVRVFSDNLRELLLASPLGQKRVLALDPGFRTGCKMVCLDAQGKLLHHEVIYATGSGKQLTDAASALLKAVNDHQIEAIAIGNGTASRETEQFVKKLPLEKAIQIVVVSESGASVYSASEVARQEFPHHDVTVRGAISIGRRLMDPLAELVKIDPKSIGVGQYQHDVDQALLKQSLEDCVRSCVNQVGVEVNTASIELLRHVSGLNRTIAENIIAYRNENGPFTSRTQLMKVPRLGAKAFEQAAGFLRIQGAKNPLDGSAVHPERYPLVVQMAQDSHCDVADLLRSGDLRQRIHLANYVSEEVGLPTLEDIITELARPGRDPRKKFELFSFTEGVEKISDLEEGMSLPGVVTNVTNFGAFVDLGVHQDGLVHISQLSDDFVEDPAAVVKVNQKVRVTVMEVDVDRKRISLSMKTGAAPERRQQDFQPKGGKKRLPQGGKQGKKKNNNPSPATNTSSGEGDDWFSQALAKSQS